MPTPTQTSRLDEPSSGSKTTQYLPPSMPRLESSVPHFPRMRRRDGGPAAEACHEDVVRDDVELLLGLAVHVRAAAFADDVFDARAPDLAPR